MDYSLQIEFISALIITFLLIYSFETNITRGTSDKWFVVCLFMTLGSILINTISVWAIDNSDIVPLWINIGLASIYYVLINATGLGLILYIVYKDFERYNPYRSITKFFCISIGLLLIVVILVVINIFTGCLFYFEDGEYYRGILNSTGYILVGIDALILIFHAVFNYNTASAAMKTMLKYMPWTLIVLLAYQMLYREILTNGMILTLSSLIIFLSFQSSPIDMDTLTGLGNRRAFLSDLGILRKSEPKIHIVFIKVGSLAGLNIKYGHNVGDEFLYSVSKALTECAPAAKVYRIDGSTFALTCTGDSCGKVDEYIQDIHSKFEEPWTIHDIEHIATARFTDYLVDDPDISISRIFESMSYGLTKADSNGNGDRITIGNEMATAIRRRRYIVDQLKRCIDNQEFEIYYQPILECESSNFTCAEALVRMFGKNGEMISPGEFIPIAEETNMIQDLSWIVVEKVCAFISTHPKLPIDCISVNFSEQQFLEDDVIERFNGLVNKYNIDPSMIRIEITESIITYHPETTREVMDKFIEQGVFFSMDDFGVKYSNFSNMLTLPFKAIKLDKTLVDKLFGTEREIQFIWSIIKMLIEAGYIVVAEGIEDPYTSKKLKSMGVHFIQGFFYSRPLPEKDFVNFLSNSGGK